MEKIYLFFKKCLVYLKEEIDGLIFIINFDPLDVYHSIAKSSYKVSAFDLFVKHKSDIDNRFDKLLALETNPSEARIKEINDEKEKETIELKNFCKKEFPDVNFYF